MSRERDEARRYWRTNLRILAILLGIWAFAGFGLGIVAVPWLDRFQVAGFPLGFWFAQQGSIVVFVLLILVYALWMDRVERSMRSTDPPPAPPDPNPPAQRAEPEEAPASAASRPRAQRAEGERSQ